MNLTQFSPCTLKHIASLAVSVSSFTVHSYNNVIDSRQLANKHNQTVLTRVSLEGIVELQKYDFILGIEASPVNIPYEIRDLTHRPITINSRSLIFQTPIFGKCLNQTPVNIIPGRGSSLLVATLPDSLIKECGSWWDLVDSTEEFTIIPEVLNIKYNSVNILNTILGKQY